MPVRPETDIPGSPTSHADVWNIERLWTKPLERLSGIARPERVREPSALLHAQQVSRMGQDRLAANADRNAQARRRLLDELAQIDITLP